MLQEEEGQSTVATGVRGEMKEGGANSGKEAPPGVSVCKGEGAPFQIQPPHPHPLHCIA